MDGENRRYSRIDKADRKTIQNGLSKRKGCRGIARLIGRSLAAVTEAKKRHRIWEDGDCRGIYFDEFAERDCAFVMAHVRFQPNPPSWACRLSGC